MPGGDYGYHPRGPGQSHWHEEQPGVVHKVLRTGFGSPTGICFYEGTLLPERFWGQLLHCDAGPREFRAFHIKPKGAGYELDKELLVTSSDTWFRLSDVCVAPDGSVMLADWYDPGVGGHGMGDWTRGRIFRVTPKGHKGYKVPSLRLDTRQGIAAALWSPNLSTQAAVDAKLRSLSDAEANTVLFAAIVRKNDANPAFLARVTGRLRGISNDADVFDKLAKELKLPQGRLPKILEQQLGAAHEHAEFRAARVRMLPRMISNAAAAIGPTFDAREQLRTELDQIVHLEGQPTEGGAPAVFRECILVLGQFAPEPPTVRIFYALAKLYDGQDHFYRAALNIACGTDPAR
jgi:hypothetical protein